MTLSIQQWHQRFLQQARWTKSLRDYLYTRIGICNATRVLDVGCGTGVLLNELSHISFYSAYGVDIDLSSIFFAHTSTPSSLLTLGNALSLPYCSGSFDISLCHFLLLWVKNPLHVLEEMVRVVRPGGFVLAFAEPDYGGRIDFPTKLAQVGSWQTESLREQGANPFIGRELRSLFSEVGLMNVEAGVLGSQWAEVQSDEDYALEWEVLKSDLNHKSVFTQVAEELKALDQSSRANHQRILYIPTFFAIGEVKG